MEQLTIDTGLREYAVNGGPEHGGGVLRFNPSDPAVMEQMQDYQAYTKEKDQLEKELKTMKSNLLNMG